MFWNRKKSIYLDYAAATPISADVYKAMKPYFTDKFYNPSALYSSSTDVRARIDQARNTIAKMVGVSPEYMTFTNGGTESINLAIRGVVEHWHTHNHDSDVLPNILISGLEHSAVRATVEDLAERNMVTFDVIPVDGNGCIQINTLSELLTPHTVLVSCMLVNNEIGTIQPINELVKKIRQHKKHTLHDVNAYYPLVHTDAIQAPHIMPVSATKLGVDMMTLSSAKIGGPKAMAMLARKPHVELAPIITGGGQESGLRSGTENTAYIVGFEHALQQAIENREKAVIAMRDLRSYVTARIDTMGVELQQRYSLDQSPLSVIGTNESEKTAPHIIGIRLHNISGEQVVIEMDARGIAIASQSACSTDSGDVPHILYALGYDDVTSGMIRISLHPATKKSDVVYACDTLVTVMDKLIATQQRFS